MKPIARPKPSWREMFSPVSLPRGGDLVWKGPKIGANLLRISAFLLEICF